MGFKEWKTCKLGDVCATISETHKQKDGNLIFLNTGDIERGRILHQKYSSVAEMPGQAKKSIKKGDILFSEIRPANGRWAFVNFNSEDYIVSTKLMVIRAKKSIRPKFLYLLLTSPEIVKWLQHLAESRSGTFPQITFSQVSDIEINLPPIQEQERISSILSSLDDKIELNRQTNQTLEAMAEALFKEMCLPKGDDLPAGWRKLMLFNICKLIGGGTPKTEIKEYWEDGTIGWISAKDITPNNGTFIIKTEKKITELGLKNSSAKLLPKLSTIISARGTVGNICIISNEMAISQSNYGLKAVILNTDYYLFCVVGSLVRELKQRAYGTVFDTITTNSLSDIEVIVPPNTVLADFNKMVKPLFETIEINLQKNQTLTSLRDSLLPKLMKGEIEIVG